jgi:hypothetical protein
MPKRIKDKNKSLFVKFHEEFAEKDVHSLLYKMGVSGVRVSSLINRWAVEVPFWKEDFYADKLIDSGMTEAIHESFDRKRKNLAPEEREDSDSE